jgi:hypothetical protein
MSRSIPNTLLIAVREAICLKPFIIFGCSIQQSRL